MTTKAVYERLRRFIFWLVTRRTVAGLVVAATVVFLFGKWGTDGRYTWVVLGELQAVFTGDDPLGGWSLSLWANAEERLGVTMGAGKDGVFQFAFHFKRVLFIWFSDTGWGLFT